MKYLLGYRVITYDRRGFGMSGKPSEGYNFDTFTEDLKILLEELSLKNVTLVGHSMGSGEVIRYIGKYGTGRVKNAVLVAPIVPFLLKTEDNKAGVDRKVFEQFKKAIRRDRYEFTSDFFKNFYNLGLINHGVSEEKLRADFNLAGDLHQWGF